MCGNEYAPDDGRVVSVDHGCGAHSEVLVEQVQAVDELPTVFDDSEVESVRSAGRTARSTRPSPPSPMATAEFGYQERPSRIPDATVWRRRAGRSEQVRILPDGCMDVIHYGGRLLVAGPDTTAKLVSVRGLHVHGDPLRSRNCAWCAGRPGR